MANTIHCPGVFPSLPEDPCNYLTPARHMRRLAQQKKQSAVRAGMGLYPRFFKVCRGKEILQTSQKKCKKKEKSQEVTSQRCWHYLFSRPVTRQVSSAHVSLTSVFGMGTGGPSPQSTPTFPGRVPPPSFYVKASLL